MGSVFTQGSKENVGESIIPNNTTKIKQFDPWLTAETGLDPFQCSVQ